MPQKHVCTHSLHIHLPYTSSLCPFLLILLILFVLHAVSVMQCECLPMCCSKEARGRNAQNWTPRLPPSPLWHRMLLMAKKRNPPALHGKNSADGVRFKGSGNVARRNACQTCLCFPAERCLDWESQHTVTNYQNKVPSHFSLATLSTFVLPWKYAVIWRRLKRDPPGQMHMFQVAFYDYGVLFSNLFVCSSQ